MKHPWTGKRCNTGLAIVHIVYKTTHNKEGIIMHKPETVEAMCKSVFKGGDATNKTDFTKAWVELINRLEKAKYITT